jgi:hypothetical protein
MVSDSEICAVFLEKPPGNPLGGKRPYFPRINGYPARLTGKKRYFLRVFVNGIAKIPADFFLKRLNIDSRRQRNPAPSKKSG